MEQADSKYCTLVLPIGSNVTVVIRGEYDEGVCHFADFLIMQIFNELPTDMVFSRKVIGQETNIKLNVNTTGLIEILNRMIKKDTPQVFLVTDICIMECNYGDISIIKEFNLNHSLRSNKRIG